MRNDLGGWIFQLILICAILVGELRLLNRQEPPIGSGEIIYLIITIIAVIFYVVKIIKIAKRKK